jgi:recombination protein RecT
MGNMNAEQALNLRDEREQAKAAGSPQVNILDEIRRMEPEYQAAMPKGAEAAQLVIGYQGYIELAMRSPNVAGIVARTAHENDLFEVHLGTDDRIIHRPVMDGPRGAPTAYYAVVKYANGGYTFVWMTRAEMERHRDQFALAKRDGKVVGPWRDNFDAMSQKTVVRQLSKFMPKSADLAHAIAADGSVRLDLDPETSPAEAAQFIDGEVVDDEPRQESAG